MNVVDPARPRTVRPRRTDDIRVMVVDDAVVVRSLVSRWIGEEPGLELVAALRDGREAVDQLERADPDVVVLDVDMPRSRRHLDAAAAACRRSAISSSSWRRR